MKKLVNLRFISRKFFAPDNWKISLETEGSKFKTFGRLSNSLTAEKESFNSTPKPTQKWKEEKKRKAYQD